MRPVCLLREMEFKLLRPPEHLWVSDKPQKQATVKAAWASFSTDTCLKHWLVYTAIVRWWNLFCCCVHANRVYILKYINVYIIYLCTLYRNNLLTSCNNMVSNKNNGRRALAMRKIGWPCPNTTTVSTVSTTSNTH